MAMLKTCPMWRAGIWRRFHAAANELAGGSLRVDTIPILKDNFCYVISDEASQVSAFVDPGDGEQALRAWEALRDAEAAFELVAVLCTHVHDDHVGGNSVIRQEVPGIEVFGPRGDSIASVTQPLDGGDVFSIGGLRVDAISTPGHTRGGMSFLVQGQGASSMPSPVVSRTDSIDGAGSDTALFCGDTLFVAGCGRFPPRESETMHASLRRIAALPGGTRVFPGHEYTAANIAFARTVDAANRDLAAKERAVHKARAAGMPSVPSTVRDELATNPFLRCGEPALARAVPAAAAERGAVGVLAALRAAKDSFRG